MPPNFIEISRLGQVLSLSLNRPDVLNSFNREMGLELLQALQAAAQDNETRCITLTGTGRAFCAGQDLSQVAPDANGNLPDLKQIVLEVYNPIIRSIRELPKPVICAVNGIAAGAGANLALACDIVLAAKEANFVQSFSKVGLIPDSGGTFILPRLIGLARASALCMLAEKISAEQACELGMIYKVCTADKLANESIELAQRLAQMPTLGLARTKQAFNASFQNSLSAQLALEAELQGECGKSYDYREGVSAFLAKRPAVFRGS